MNYCCNVLAVPQSAPFTLIKIDEAHIIMYNCIEIDGKLRHQSHSSRLYGTDVKLHLNVNFTSRQSQDYSYLY